jgi:hypothetical protein
MGAPTACRLRDAVVAVAACCAAYCLPAPAQEAVAPATSAAVAEPPAPPDIVVRGRSFTELRLQILRAEEAVFGRFNDINSSDDFDIHCRAEVFLGSRIAKRSCVSNSWREQDTNIAQSMLGQLRGETGPSPQQFVSEQQAMQHKLDEEMGRLAREDEQLAEAVLTLGQAKFALARRTGRAETFTVSHEVTAGRNGLPYDAQRLFEVRVGDAPWTHPLTQRTFAFASVTGRIRSLALECGDERQSLDYEPDAEWTVPPAWSSCTLAVRAKKGTTFALLEF